MGSLIAFCSSTKPGNRCAKQMLATAIVGASKAEQLEQSLPAVDLTLDEQLLAACDAIWYQLPRERNKDIAFR